MKHLVIAVVAAAAGTALVVPPAAASASASEGRQFGQHVIHCAQTVGFDGMHNPGMHQGFSGFAADHPCVMA